VLESLGPALARHPTAFGHMLADADIVINGAVELAIVGDPQSDEFRKLYRTAAGEYVPALVLAGGPAESPREGQPITLLAERGAIGGRATAYVCRHYTCDVPTSDANELREQLLGLRVPAT
jgi:uncharacterized protein YyaL (SSP411 family)